MSTFEIIRMPQDKEQMQEILVEMTPYLDAMYTPQDEELFGPINFIFDHWLFLWDTGAGAFLTERDDNGELLMVAVLTQFRDIWHARPRMEIQRIAVSDKDMDSEATVLRAIEYLKSVATLLRFDLLYYNSRDLQGNEIKELVWNGKA